jgi:hypothetical protein
MFVTIFISVMLLAPSIGAVVWLASKHKQDSSADAKSRLLKIDLLLHSYLSAGWSLEHKSTTALIDEWEQLGLLKLESIHRDAVSHDSRGVPFVIESVHTQEGVSGVVRLADRRGPVLLFSFTSDSQAWTSRVR